MQMRMLDETGLAHWLKDNPRSSIRLARRRGAGRSPEYAVGEERLWAVVLDSVNLSLTKDKGSS